MNQAILPLLVMVMAMCLAVCFGYFCCPKHSAVRQSTANGCVVDTLFTDDGGRTHYYVIPHGIVKP